MRLITLTICFIFNILSTVTYSDDNILSLQELYNKSTDIIIGKVESKKCFYYNNNNKRIYTSIKIKAEDSIKGTIRRNDTVDIIFYGGTLNGIIITVLGAPNYEVGEETILFLRETTSEPFGRRYIVRGRSQGKFNIFNDNITRDCPFPLYNKMNGHIIPVSKSKSITINEFRRYINNIK